MRCLKCERELSESASPRASISVMVMGDEYIYSYVYCDNCKTFTVESYYDRFLGEEQISFFTVDKDTGDRAIELIRACPDPHDKNCNCPSHKALYYGKP